VKVVETRVDGLVFDPKTQQHVVVLREVDGERVLPIWIGPPEAMAIKRLLQEEGFPRPLTHDLIALVIEGLKAKVTRIVIADLREGTFFASLLISRESDVLSVDARPSDSIAIALRTKAPVYVNEELLQAPPELEQPLDPAPPDEPSGPSEPSELTQEQKAEQLRRFIEKLNPEDFGKFSM
jgi:bifunctional DNase/RNase